MRLIVGMTGATGAPLGVALLQALREMPNVETHLVMSKWAKTTIELETPYSARDVAALADFSHNPADQAATISSGSFRTDGMIVIPCSMKTLAGIRAGYADGLVGRAADVVLKEGRKLVPMHDIALHLHKAEERGEDLPIAITLGNDPIITLMGATPLKYDQSEYEMAGALRESPYPIATAPLTGFDVPWGSEVILEGVIESRKREIEGPFGEFTGHYSGGRNMTVVRIDKVSYRSKPIFESLYLGMPWTEIDYLMGPATCVPLYQQLKAEFPEVQAVNAMYTHGLLAIISTKKRYGGFARAVGLRAMTTPHGLGYVKMVIMVDEDVDPFNLPQVMWALSSKVNPAGDLVQLPNMSVLELDPGSSPAGITDKLIIDATTPVAPDNRGHYSQPVVDLPETKAWAEKLTAMLAARK
ncbi:TPA: UbiD family decarboxylase [Escherichia coli]|nr:UbiD family decarboxylase [Escherichia coli]